MSFAGAVAHVMGSELMGGFRRNEKSEVMREDADGGRGGKALRARERLWDFFFCNEGVREGRECLLMRE